MSRTLRYGILATAAAGGVLLYWLAVASSNTQLFAQHYPMLLAANGVIALALLAVVTTLIVRVVRRVRAGRFGARLMARLAVAFALMGAVPGALIYVVSIQFLSKSIESWFDVRVDRALEAGLSLGRAALEAQLSDLTAQAQAIAIELAEVPESMQLSTLDHARERAGVHEAVLLGAHGQVLGTSGAAVAGLVPTLPQASALRQARMQRSYAVIEGDEFSTDPRTGLRTRVIVPITRSLRASQAQSKEAIGRNGWHLGPISGLAGSAQERYLQLTQRAAPTVLANASGLLKGYREYQDLSLSRSALRKIYSVTLTLTLLLAVLAAVAGGITLASSMAAPLLQVAAGTRAVAEGNFRQVREFKGKDELGTLTQSFNAMTRQLAEAHHAVETRSRELESARAFLERVLANLSAGVLVLDAELKLVTVNHGAGRILNLPLASHLGKALADLLPQLADRIARGFADQHLTVTPTDSWQQQVELARASASASTDPLVLLVRGSRLPLEEGPGYVIVFDDITQIISAQRTLAWSEVARRLAHEIKNPLTPIQLAAERLHMKLSGQLPPDREQVLSRATSTIINQVAALKRLVDEFREYARLPAAKLAPLDLNALIADVAGLYGAADASAQKGTELRAAVALKLDPQLPKILADSEQLRQVLHNLLGNAKEAMQAHLGSEAGQILISTSCAHKAEATTPEHAQVVRLTIEDEGPGFPAHILRRAFEPYVTTKPSGTGLGLAMVKKIIDEHDARIELANRKATTTLGSAGASVSIAFRRFASDAALAGAPAKNVDSPH